MKYFIANLSVQLLITLFLILLIVVFSNRNRRGQTSHGFIFFMPLFLSILTVLHLLYFTAPRLLDIASVRSQNYYSYTGVLEETSLMNNYLIVDGEQYYINPLRDLPPSGTTVKIRYTQYSHYAIEVAPAEMVNVTDSINEEMQTSVTIESETEG